MLVCNFVSIVTLDKIVVEQKQGAIRIRIVLCCSVSKQIH